MNKFKSLKWKKTNLRLIKDLTIVSSGYSDRFKSGSVSVRIEHDNGVSISKQYERCDVLNTNSVHGLILTLNGVENNYENRLKISKMLNLLSIETYVSWETNEIHRRSMVDYKIFEHILHVVMSENQITGKEDVKICEADIHFEIIQSLLDKIDLEHSAKNRPVLGINVINSYFEKIR